MSPMSYHQHLRRIKRAWRVWDAIYEVSPPTINGEWEPYVDAWLERIHKWNVQIMRLEKLAWQQYHRSRAGH